MDEKKNMKYMKRYQNKVPINTTVSQYSHKLAKDNNIAWSYALEIGIRSIVNERNKSPSEVSIIELQKRIENMSKIFNKNQRRLWALEEELKQKKINDF